VIATSCFRKEVVTEWQCGSAVRQRRAVIPKKPVRRPRQVSSRAKAEKVALGVAVGRDWLQRERRHPTFGGRPFEA
jgi:hypothetical protein